MVEHQEDRGGRIADSRHRTRNDFAKSHHAQVKGKAEAVLAVLDARGIELTAEQKRRVQRSTSQASLDKWLRRAAIAQSADEVFA